MGHATTCAIGGVASVVLTLAGCAPSLPSGGSTSAVREVWRIGSLDEPRYTFTEVLGAAIDTDHRLYLVQRNIAEVWVYDSLGRWERSIGRYGEGPGELVQPGRVGVTEAGIWVTDVGSSRLSLFSRDGRYLASTRFALPPGRVTDRTAGLGTLVPRARFADGTILSWPRLALGLLPKDTRIPLVKLDSAGRVLDLLSWRRIEDYDLEIRYLPGRRFLLRHPLSHSDLYTLDPLGRHLTIAQMSKPEVLRLVRVRYDGDTLFVRDHHLDPVPVTDEVVQRMIDRLYAQWTGLQSRVSREGFGRAYRAALAGRTPASIPPVSNAIAATDGSLWLRREDNFDETVRWERYNERGGLVASVVLPSRIEVLASTGEGLIAVERGPLDIPTVVRYDVSGGSTG